MMPHPNGIFCGWGGDFDFRLWSRSHISVDVIPNRRASVGEEPAV
jgi:hypothetical protein